MRRQLTQLAAASAGVQRQQWEPVGGDAAGLRLRRQLSFPPYLVLEESRQLVVAPRSPSDARAGRYVESGPWAAGQEAQVLLRKLQQRLDPGEPVARRLRGCLLRQEPGAERVALRTGEVADVWVPSLTLEQRQCPAASGDRVVGAALRLAPAVINVTQANAGASFGSRGG